MESRIRSIKANQNPDLHIEVMPGHFATRNSHINYYVNITRLKSQQSLAKSAAIELARPFISAVPIDAIVCLDGTEVVAAFLAEALQQDQAMAINSHAGICVVTPEISSNGQFMFRDNTQGMIWNKQVLLLVASATTGATMNQAIDCIRYYNGQVSGIAALFSIADEVYDIPVHSLFNQNDIPDYQTWSAADCPECKAGMKIDALVNSFGYSRVL